MAKLDGFKRLAADLKGRARRAAQESEGSVVVGFTAAYAVYVHEDLEAYHAVGQAKFLEQPAREMRLELGGIVRENLRRGRTVVQSLLVAGLRLQREAQLLCPVDTGNLRNSAFTRQE